VTWTSARGRSTRIGASPVEVAEILRERVFHRNPAVVLTSATLAVDGSFDFVRTRLGVDFDAEEMVLASPFDYSRQAAVYLPEDMPDPRDDAFPDRAAQRVLELIELTGGGAFVLCTSLRMMRALAERCRPELDLPSAVQGEAPNHELLERFRAQGDGVLFATASFWQGVDVPGDALRLVIMDKLPFDVPTDPLVQARCERIKRDGSEPFMKYLVPSAALSLKQGFGRLIRSRRDRGVVAILDSRLQRKGYGKRFLRSLPPALRCATLPEVERFWHEQGGDA
jgi:ATP-dependent DNA helicase DinG